MTPTIPHTKRTKHPPPPSSPEPPLHIPSVIATLVILLTCIKILLIPSYRSTDFDVHRNWLALTRSLPPSEWYFDTQNERTVHTLDYPPLFAWFEALLSRNGITTWLLRNNRLDARCLERLPDDDNDVSDACVIFHRFTVILSDVVLFAGAFFASRSVLLHRNSKKKKKKTDDDDDEARLWKFVITVVLIVSNPGLLLLDHVHFQYNGMLLGILLLSMACICSSEVSGERRSSSDVIGAILFAILLVMKHLYLILAPLYFVYLLRHYCYASTSRNTTTTTTTFSIQRFSYLAFVTLATLILPFVPFLIHGNDPIRQLTQIVKRLFPFERGLCHDYWAGNVWALYSFFDKLVRFAKHRVVVGDGLLPSRLPDVPPNVTAALLGLALVPVSIQAWRAASRNTDGNATISSRSLDHFFVHGVIYSSFSGFMLAYHVHEKAIMSSIIPMTLLSTTSRPHARLYLRTCAIGHLGLLPLLFHPRELLLKLSISVAHLSVSIVLLEYVFHNNNNNETKKEGLITIWDAIGLGVIVTILIFAEVIHPLMFRPRQLLEFLPLMMISVVCAIGLVGNWIQSGVLMWNCWKDLTKRKQK